MMWGPTPRIRTAGLVILCGLAYVQNSLAQIVVSERVFSKSKGMIEKALKEIQPSMSGRLPVLEGFALPGEHPLERYQRGYYEATAQVSASGDGSVVRVVTKVTAWYSDTVSARSGYQLLKSNGRIEADLLDQLAEQLAKGPPALAVSAQENTRPLTADKADPVQTKVPGPALKFPQPGGAFSAAMARSLGNLEKSGPGAAKEAPRGVDNVLRAEAVDLEEVVKSQTSPENLVVIKKSGTPVVATASLKARTLFLASAHDEFEMLDFNEDWVHVRISGLSRGWIWRNSVEMPNSVAETATQSGPPTAAEMFHVTRELAASFPGDWEPLRGRTVKIISVQKIDETDAQNGPEMKAAFAKSLLDRSYKDVAQKSPDISGIVLIFDSADGGMIAATIPVLQKWESGALSDAAFWHQCFFDPPEMFNPSISPAR